MAVSQSTFQKTFGDYISEKGKSVIQTSDNGFVIVGNSNSFGAGSSDVYVVKTDSNGQLLWSKTYGSASNESGFDLISTSDNGLAILGITDGFGAGDYDMLLIRTDGNGDTIWAKTYGGPLDDLGHSLIQMNDGGFILVGETSSYGAGLSDVYLVRTNSVGDLLWSRTFGGTEADQGYYVERTSDSGIIIAGITTSYDQGFSDIYVVKTDSSGNLQWAKSYGSPEYESIGSIKPTSDGGYIICGSQDVGQAILQAYLIKTDSVGDTLWTKLYGGNFNQTDQAFEVLTLSDGDFIVIGRSTSFGPRTVLLMRLTSSGDTVWSKTYGGTVVTDEGRDIIRTNDGGLVLTGSTGNFGAGGVFLFKTDSNGYSNCNHSVVHPYLYNTVTMIDSGGQVDSGCVVNNAPLQLTNPATIDTNVCDTSTGLIPIQAERYEISVFPNPFNNSITISTIPRMSFLRLDIYDVVGHLVYQESVTANSSQHLTFSELNAGVYFLKATTSYSSNKQKNVVTIKLLKQ